MRNRMAALVNEGKLHGIVTLIERHGKIVSLDAFGTRTVGGKEPMRADTIFQIQSMTKPVAAVAAAILVERGRLRWNDSASTYLPAFESMKLSSGEAAKTPIQLRHLLNHTSGISSDMPVEDEDRASMTLAQFVELIEKQPLRSEPGTEVRYSGPGFSVAGRIVEIVSRKPFEVFCEDEIFRPLGMADTHYFLPKSKENRLSGVASRDSDALKPLPADPMRTGSKFANPAGGLYSTARDMARFQRDMLQKKGRILSREMIRLMTTASPRIPGSSEEFGYGIGWSIARGPGPTRSLLPPGTFGHVGAFGTYSWSDPENDIVGVFMTQGAFGLDAEIATFRTMVYASLTLTENSPKN